MIIPLLVNVPPAPLVIPFLAQASIPIYVPPPEREIAPASVDGVSPPSARPSPAPNVPSVSRLQSIVNEAVRLAASRRLPQNRLSIALIDVKTGEIAGHRQQQFVYPASVVKLFWMAAFYAQIENRTLSNEAAFASDLSRMIRFSSNEASSRMFDAITNTQSGGNLSGEAYRNWLANRTRLNEFFHQRGYQSLRIHQKVYPILSLGLNLPRGRELQMRGNPRNPIRNRITSEQAARLLREMATNQSVSPAASQKMIQLLSRNRDQPLSSMPRQELLLRSSLPADVNVFSKAGWTTSELHQAGYITAPDGTAYVLVVFGSDRAFVSNSRIFPDISRLVYNRMTNQ